MRQEKQLLLDEIKQTIDSPFGVIVASYNKLDANAAATLRHAIYEKGGRLLVVPKRVLLKAAEQVEFDIDAKVLEGHIAVCATGENVVDATKAFVKFQEDNEDIIHIIAGQFEGKVCSAQEFKEISELPSKDEMRASLLGLFEAVPSNLLATMDSLLTSVVYCLENKINQSEES